MKVLIVDDSKVIIKMVTQMLESLGHSADFAEDGKIACEKIQGGDDFDIILLDWNMPNMTGVEFLEFNKANGLTNASIIMMTTENKPEFISTALSLGASEYIMKPFTEDILNLKIQEVVG